MAQLRSVRAERRQLGRRSRSIFTVFYVLIGIGILVEMIRQIGFGFVAMRAEQTAARHAKHQSDTPTGNA
jgi:hypothetical protein